MTILVEKANPIFMSKTVQAPSTSFVEIMSIYYPLNRSREHGRFCGELAVAGYSLNGFDIRASFHIDGQNQILYTTTADYETPVGKLLYATGDLTLIAAGGYGGFVFDIAGIYKLSFWARSSNVAGSDVTIRGMLE